MTSTIDEIVARLARQGIQLVDDAKTHEAAHEAHRLGRHDGFPTYFASVCPTCFGKLAAIEGSLVIK